MRKITLACVFVFALSLFVDGTAMGETLTFKKQPPAISETKTKLVQSLEAGFSHKAGGDLFSVKVGAEKVRYEYEGEYYQFVPIGRALLSTKASLENEMALADYWNETDIKISVREFGVKVDIILKSPESPRAFSFQIEKSNGWQDEWIRPVYAFSVPHGVPVLIESNEVENVLTYQITEKLPPDFFPVVIDPTFDLAASADDMVGVIRGGTPLANGDTSALNIFGRYWNVTYGNYQWWAYIRYELPLTRGENIQTARLHWKAERTFTPVFNTTISSLEHDSLWEDGGFTVAHYATGQDLVDIVRIEDVTWSSVAAWTVGNWYYSPDISTLLQSQVDNLAAYDPLDSENKYVGYAVDDGDGAFNGTSYRRFSDSWNGTPGDAVEFVVTSEPWGEVRVGAGYKIDKATGYFRYFDY